MIPRYQTAVGDLWSTQYTSDIYAKIQMFLAKHHPAIPDAAAEAMFSTDAPTPEEWAEEEEKTGHDIAAWVNVFSRKVGEHGRWVHYGMTSSDLVDTANAFRYSTAMTLIKGAVRTLEGELSSVIGTHLNTERIGRTHGQWASMTTLGHQLRVIGWQLDSSIRLLDRVHHQLKAAKLSGPVGQHDAISPNIEFAVLCEFGLHPTLATQIVPRHGVARAVSEFAILASIIEQLAMMVRLGSQSEIGELREGAAEIRVGSSSMPHKQNPITAEKLCGLARVQRSYLYPVLETLGGLWGERDISNSSVERVVVPDAFNNIMYLIEQASDLIADLVVDEDRIAHNLAKAQAESQSAKLLSLVIKHTTLSRQAAHDFVRHVAVAAARGGVSLTIAGHLETQRLTQDPEVEKGLREALEFLSD